MIKMAVKRTGIVEKHCGAFVIFLRAFVHKQRKFISIEDQNRIKGRSRKYNL
jgi:hypothetical protein